MGWASEGKILDNRYCQMEVEKIVSLVNSIIPLYSNKQAN